MEEENQEVQEIKKEDKHSGKNGEKMEKIQLEKLRGRVIIFNSEQSEFAKSLGLTKKGDYTQKKQ